VSDPATRADTPSPADLLALAEQLPQLAWIADADGSIYWYNQRWYDYTGRTAEEMRGWGWQSVHDPKVLPDVLERWRTAIKLGEPFEMVFPLRAADGRYRPFLTRVQPSRDPEGRVMRWFGTNTDIGEQHEIARSLAQEKALLETLNRTISVVSAELDLEKLVQTVTEAGVSLTGAKFGAFFYNVIDARAESTSRSSQTRARPMCFRPRSGAKGQFAQTTSLRMRDTVGMLRMRECRPVTCRSEAI
jgi:PAS domain S-box-containing protein